MKKIFRLEVAAAAVAVPLALAAPSGPAAPHLAATTVQWTGNWAGYGDVGGSYHDVGAVWKVPAIPATKSRAYAYFWVGLGGAGGSGWLNTFLFSSGLAQIGIIEISGPGAGYYAFFGRSFPAQTGAAISRPARPISSRTPTESCCRSSRVTSSLPRSP
jgi:hypothetical protein